jgi:hypothetical protein
MAGEKVCQKVGEGRHRAERSDPLEGWRDRL